VVISLYRMKLLKHDFIRYFKCTLFYLLATTHYPILAQEWLTVGMKSINPYDFLNHSERNAYYEALFAMEAFHDGTGDYDDYRDAIASYANGRFFRSDLAKAELDQIDKYGKKTLESSRDEKLFKISEEAKIRNITPKQFEAARFLFEEMKIDENHPLNSSYAFKVSANPTLRSRIEDAKKILDINYESSFNALDLDSDGSSLLSSRDAKIKYWRMIYDGATRQEAEEYRANIISEINQRKLINVNKSISNEINSLKNEVEKLRKQDQYNY
jgi:hypothetical protein